MTFIFNSYEQKGFLISAKIGQWLLKTKAAEIFVFNAQEFVSKNR